MTHSISSEDGEPQHYDLGIQLLDLDRPSAN